MDLTSIALQGLSQAEGQLDSAASALATAGAASPSGANLDVVDLSSQVVALTSAQTIFAINLDVLKSADQLQQNLINLTA
jgi:flagellar hook protein FlgE